MTAARRVLAAVLLAAVTAVAAAACAPPQPPPQPAPSSFTADPQPYDPPHFPCPPGQRWVYMSSGWECVR